MTFGFVNPKHKQTWLRSARLATASLVAVIATGNLAGAASSRNEPSVGSIESRAAGEPIMAIVSLRSQQITVYDANGWILRAPVSSGQKGRETPAGVFSVIQKEAEHYSNLYDDAYMPHMQRLTWSGIALHGGPLPGYPASHGCVRMPYDFAERLFDATKLGMRVIVAPNDVAPALFTHPALWSSPTPGSGAVAAARAAEADEATRNADLARFAVVIAAREVARAMVPVRAMRYLRLKAEVQLVAAERAVASAESAEAKDQASDAKAAAAARLAEFEAQLTAAEAELQPKLDAVSPAREAAVAAETARVEKAEAARKVASDLEPMSIFISRKTQHLYIRQTLQPVVEIPVTIRDPDLPIGTHVFTAMERAGGNGDMQWSVVSLAGGHSNGGMAELHNSVTRDGHVDQILTDPANAKAALDRITIPQDTFDQIAGVLSPRSSLIISDEALSSETGHGTEFVIIMSGEPQGGINTRRRRPETEIRFDGPGGRLPYRHSLFTAPYSTW
jgi:hypothetical protein